MKKKLLIMLLACCLVLAFSGLAQAADNFSVTADAGDGHPEVFVKGLPFCDPP